MQYMENPLWHGVKTHVGANFKSNAFEIVAINEKMLQNHTLSLSYFLPIIPFIPLGSFSIINQNVCLFSMASLLLLIGQGSFWPCTNVTCCSPIRVLHAEGQYSSSASLLLDVQRWAKDWLSLLLNLLLQVMSQCKAFTLCKSPSVDWPGVEQW